MSIGEEQLYKRQTYIFSYDDVYCTETLHIPLQYCLRVMNSLLCWVKAIRAPLTKNMPSFKKRQILIDSNKI